MPNQTIEDCAHPRPVDGWGMSQVNWGKYDPETGVQAGTLYQYCAECGEMISWKVKG